MGELSKKMEEEIIKIKESTDLQEEEKIKLIDEIVSKKT